MAPERRVSDLGYCPDGHLRRRQPRPGYASLFKRQRVFLPVLSLLYVPAVDMLFQGGSVTTNAGKDWISRERLDSLRSIYLSGIDPKEPLVSPLYGDLRGLPPLMIQVGSRELLLDDISGFVEKAKSAGVDVAFEIWDEMIHCWQIFASVLKEGQEAVRSMGMYMRKRLGSQG